MPENIAQHQAVTQPGEVPCGAQRVFTVFYGFVPSDHLDPGAVTCGIALCLRIELHQVQDERQEHETNPHQAQADDDAEQGENINLVDGANVNARHEKNSLAAPGWVVVLPGVLGAQRLEVGRPRTHRLRADWSRVRGCGTGLRYRARLRCGTRLRVRVHPQDWFGDVFGGHRAVSCR